jgi:hypothetical protein
MNGTFRHEQKYFINLQDAALLRSRLLSVIKKDENAGEKGEYWIRSLYFDDCRSSAYEEKDMGIMCRKKYRIRVYECSDKVIRLERKNKVGPYINKQSAPLTRDETERILAGDYLFLRDSAYPLLREFYFECISNIMRPRVIVDYDREPFVMDEGDVRITFDKHIRAGLGGFDLFDKELPAIEALPVNVLVLEVKFTQFLPEIVKRALRDMPNEITAASKFVLCCDVAQGAYGLDAGSYLPLNRYIR